MQLSRKSFPMTETPQPNPLLEASEVSLQELFSRNPAELTGLELESMVAELRRMAAKWAMEEASGATKASRPKKASPAGNLLKKQVDSLDDLGL